MYSNNFLKMNHYILFGEALNAILIYERLLCDIIDESDINRIIVHMWKLRFIEDIFFLDIYT